jgi:hypothetical protein
MRGAMAAVARRRRAPRRTAKACGPDLPTLGSSLRVMIPQATVAKEPGHRGERVISRNTIARGMPVVPAEPVLLACVMRTRFCTQGSRVRPASGIPRALFSSRVPRRCITRAHRAAGTRMLVTESDCAVDGGERTPRQNADHRDYGRSQNAKSPKLGRPSRGPPSLPRGRRDGSRSRRVHERRHETKARSSAV